MLPHQIIATAIDAADLNRGLRGAAWLASEGNIPVTFDNGDIALFNDEGDGVFEGHFLFVSRGKEAIAHAREALRVMFEDHKADLLFGLTPDCLRPAKLVSRMIGFRSAGIRDTSEGPCELFVLSKNRWKGAA